MGNNYTSCCPKDDLCYFLRDKEKVILNDLDLIEMYSTKKIISIQAIIRGYQFRKLIKGDNMYINFNTSSMKMNFNKNMNMYKNIDDYNNQILQGEDKILTRVENGLSDNNINNDNNNDPSTNKVISSSSDKNKIKRSKTAKKSKNTPNGFLPELCPGKILLDEEVDQLAIKKNIFETEKRIGAFIIEEKEIYKYLEDYKYKLRKHQIKYEDGTVYIGYYDPNWEKEGYGILIHYNGSKYEGMFKKNFYCGRGRLIHPEGDYYEGEFEDDKANGFGKYVNKSGGIYIGYWCNDKQHGRGEELFNDGSRYEGSYEDGLKSGNGKMTWPDGSVFEGEFHKNLIEGYGIYRWRDGRIYKGEWKKNKMEGVGLFVWPDKKKYFGQYLNDMKSGYGVFIWPDKRKYEGQWLNGKQNGYGIFSFSNKKKFGIFKNGIKENWLNIEDEADNFKLIYQEINKITENINFNNIIVKSDESSLSSP